MRSVNATGLAAMAIVLGLPSRVIAAPNDVPPPAPASVEAAPAPAARAPSSPPPPEPSPVSGGITRRTVALVAAGIAVAGAGAATAFGVLALENKSDYAKSPTYAGSGNGNNDAAYADGCIALAVAAGITSLVLLLTDDTAHASTARSAILSAAPIVTSRGGGAGVLLRF